MFEGLPLHLLLPLMASVIFVFGLILIKRASDKGVNQWTITFTANILAFLLFSNYLWLGDNTPAAAAADSAPFDYAAYISQLWQPAVIAVLFILGQVFTFSAISYGDVSLATPVFSVKVILVAFLVTVAAGEHLTWVVWLCAFMATIGIGLVQFGGKRSGGSVGWTIVLALFAASSFATHDLLVQQWSPGWPMSLFLPSMFAVAAVLSLGFLPFIDNPFKLDRTAILLVIGGALCIALQAICIISSLSLFGDAARVNIVYALRGLWGVLLAFVLAKQFQSNEAKVSQTVMIYRLVGAGLLTAAVIMAILQ